MENMALVNWNAIKEKKHLIEFSIYISYRFVFRYKVGYNNQLLNRYLICSYVWRSTDSGNLHQHCHQKLWVNIALLRIILTYARENRSTYHIFYVRNVRTSAYSARASTRARSWSAKKFLMVRIAQENTNSSYTLSISWHSLAYRSKLCFPSAFYYNYKKKNLYILHKLNNFFTAIFIQFS